MASIYEITSDIAFINQMLEADGEVDEEALKGALEVSKEDLVLKLEDYCKVIKNFEAVKEVIGGIRTIRLQKNIAQKETLSLQVVGENPVVAFNSVIAKLCNLTNVESVENKAD